MSADMDMNLRGNISLMCGKYLFRTENNLQLLDGGTGINYEQLFTDRYGEEAAREGFSAVELDNVCRSYHFRDRLSDREKELRDYIMEREKERMGGIFVIPGCYPPGILLGSTWNRDVVYEVGRALGMEARVHRIHCLLGTPNVNLLRDPRNGRFYEGYSEDPMLAGALGAMLVRGVQDEGVAANVKHFAANNLEINRSGIDQHISMRALRELYLPAFKDCVDAGVATLMTSYPAINGKMCVENKWLLTEVLRDEWGFQGVNMTDWGACTGDAAVSAESGIDLFMPGPWPDTDLVRGVQEGTVQPETIARAADRIRRLREKYGPQSGAAGNSVDEEKYLRIGRDTAYRATCEGIVMVKNSGCCPIDAEEEFLLFGGEGGDGEVRICGSGSAQVFTSRTSSIADHLKIRRGDFDAWQKGGRTAIVMCSMDSAEGTDRETLELPGFTVKLLETLAKSKGDKGGHIILVLNVPGPVVLGECAELADACFVVYYPGSEGARALCDILTGRVNPSGKLTCTWPLRAEDMPSYLCYPDGYSSNYGEGIYVGYRGYEATGRDVLFPFGFGLSYASFEISARGVSLEKGVVSVKVAVTNNSQVAGAEVVQVYSSDPYSRLRKPIKELRGFEKLYLEPGQTSVVDICFGVRKLAAFDEDLGKFVLEDGLYELYVGASAADVVLAGTIRVDEDADSDYRPGVKTPLIYIRKSEELLAALRSDIERTGSDYMALLNCMRYTPSLGVADIYDNYADFTDFRDACARFVKL